MSGLEGKREVTVTLALGEAYAERLERSLGRALEALGKLDDARYQQLVNTATVDDLLALRLTIRNTLEGTA
jgi:hypothetical protein